MYENLKDKKLMYKVIKRKDNGEVLVSIRNDLSPFIDSTNVQVDLIEYGKLIREMCLKSTINSDLIDVFIEDITTLKLFELMVKNPVIPTDSIFQNEYDKLEFDNSGVSRFGFVLNKKKILDRVLNELIIKFDEFIIIEEREPKPQYNPFYQSPVIPGQCEPLKPIPPVTCNEYEEGYSKELKSSSSDEDEE